MCKCRDTGSKTCRWLMPLSETRVVHKVDRRQTKATRRAVRMALTTEAYDAVIMTGIKPSGRNFWA